MSVKVLHCLRQITVEPVLFLFMFATFMQYMVLQDLLYSKVCVSQFNATVCDDLYHEENAAELERVQSDSSMWILVSSVSLAVPSLVTANLLGSWGDTFGRKLPLLIPSIGGVLSCVVYTWTSVTSVSVWAFVLASAVSGAFGGVVSCIMSVMSYVSSVTSQPSRTQRVSLLEAMTFVGGTAGPFAGGALLACSNHATVFLVIALCHILLIIYVMLRVPEIPGSGTGNEVKNKYCNATHFKSSSEACFKERPGNARAAILCFLVCCLVLMITTIGEMNLTFLYVKDQPLQWDYTTYSYYFGLKFGVGSLAVIVGSPLLAHYQVSDYVICGAGIVSKIAGFVLLGLASTDLLMFLVPFASMFSFFCIPALRSLLSKQVKSAEMGKMFAFVAGIENLSLLFGSVMFNSLYPIAKTVHQGFIFQIAAALQIIPLTIICWTSMWGTTSVPVTTYASLEAPS